MTSISLRRRASRSGGSLSSPPRGSRNRLLQRPLQSVPRQAEGLKSRGIRSDPDCSAWEILFGYLQAQPADDVRSDKFGRYLDAMEKVGDYSSSEPRDIYAFYVQRGMAERAKKFRQEAKSAAPYDLDYYSSQVNENPSLYKQE